MSQQKNELNGSQSYEIFLTHALMHPWKQILENGQLQTWAATEIPGLRHIYGKPVNQIFQSIDDFYWKLKWSKLSGRFILALEYVFSKALTSIKPKFQIPKISYTAHDVLVDLPDLYFLSNVKSLAMHEFAKNSEFDYVVFTTTSSYINRKLLEQHLGELPRENLVAGRIVKSREKTFISGSFRIYTPDVLKNISRIRTRYKSWLAEDLAMGILLETEGYHFVNIPSIDVDSISALDLISDTALRETVHFRVKSGPTKSRSDVPIMKELHKRLVALGAV